MTSNHSWAEEKSHSCWDHGRCLPLSWHWFQAARSWTSTQQLAELAWSATELGSCQRRECLLRPWTLRNAWHCWSSSQFVTSCLLLPAFRSCSELEAPGKRTSLPGLVETRPLQCCWVDQSCCGEKNAGTPPLPCLILEYLHPWSNSSEAQANTYRTSTSTGQVYCPARWRHGWADVSACSFGQETDTQAVYGGRPRRVLKYTLPTGGTSPGARMSRSAKQQPGSNTDVYRDKAYKISRSNCKSRKWNHTKSSWSTRTKL
jgi:hypothetical protein